ncbi:hypothetical protein NW072_05295 [Mycoplasmopsis felis]|nr:hypothetical protein [Mycoplasmopsis felis]UWV79426.1 hypothetical protein NW072_05295 [Mycoplasmopsis felis]
MLEEAEPQSFADLISLSGLSRTELMYEKGMLKT